MQKYTKILCTLGPSSLDSKMIEKLVKSGANAFRINTAHGDFVQYAKIIKNIRKVGRHPVMIDIKGPELRVRLDENLTVRRGHEVFISYTKSNCCFSQQFKGHVEVGDTILFDDGRIRGRIADIQKKGIFVRFQQSGVLRPNRTVSIPDRDLQLPGLTKRDREAIAFAKEQKAAYIALSFTRDEEDVLRLKRYLKGTGIGIIAKIENKQGVQNAPSILRHCHGIMVARGDLGIEINQENIPAVQKRLIRLCNEQGKIAIVATQVLESMVENPTQTRAETTDIANAILDGADTIMLSEETAIGKYPHNCVKVLTSVAKVIEQEFALKERKRPANNVSQALTVAAASLVRSTRVDKIVSLTRSGYTAMQIARFRLRVPIFAVTPDALVAEQMALVSGVSAIHAKGMPPHGRVPWVANELYKEKLVGKNDSVLFMAGVHTTKDGVSNFMEVNVIDDLLYQHQKNKKA